MSPLVALETKPLIEASAAGAARSAPTIRAAKGPDWAWAKPGLGLTDLSTQTPLRNANVTSGEVVDPTASPHSPRPHPATSAPAP